MKKTILTTMASYTFFHFLIAPIFLLVMIYGLALMADNILMYLQITIIFLCLYLMTASTSVAYNIGWKVYKNNHPKKKWIIPVCVIVVLFSLILGSIGIFNLIISFLTVLIANKLVTRFKRRIQIILAIAPLVIIIAISIGFYVWNLFQ